MRKDIYLPILGIAAGELMMLSGQVFIGLVIHIINLLAINPEHNFQQSPSGN